MKLSECERVCVGENKSECEREGVSTEYELKWGASRMRESVINYFMLDININSFSVCIFLLPV